MASFDFYTIADVLVLSHVRRPSYPVGGSPLKNVVYSETVGGKVRSEVRGADRRKFSLQWRMIHRTQLEAFLAWHATYGGMRVPFLIEVPEGLTDLPAGSKLRTRNEDKELLYRWIGHESYEVTVNLIEEVLSSIILTPAAAKMVLSATGPSAVIISGSLIITPADVAMVLATVNPTVVLGSTSLAPAPASFILATVDPTVLIDLPVTPAPASMVLAGVDPTVVIA